MSVGLFSPFVLEIVGTTLDGFTLHTLLRVCHDFRILLIKSSTIQNHVWQLRCEKDWGYVKPKNSNRNYSWHRKWRGFCLWAQFLRSVKNQNSSLTFETLLPKWVASQHLEGEGISIDFSKIIKKEDFHSKLGNSTGKIEIVEEFGIGVKVCGKPISFTIPHCWDGSLVKLFFFSHYARKLEDPEEIFETEEKLDGYEQDLAEMRSFLNRGLIDPTESLLEQVAPLLRLFSPHDYSVKLQELSLDIILQELIQIPTEIPRSNSSTNACDMNFCTQPCEAPYMSDDRINYYKQLFTGFNHSTETPLRNFLRPVIFMVSIRGDNYILDGHHKFLAIYQLLCGRDHAVDDPSCHPKISEPMFPLALVVSLHQPLPPLYRNLFNTPWSLWCKQIVNPNTSLTPLEYSMVEKNKEWEAEVLQEFKYWQNYCNPVYPTGKLQKLYLGNLPLQTTVKDILIALSYPSSVEIFVDQIFQLMPDGQKIPWDFKTVITNDKCSSLIFGDVLIEQEWGLCRTCKIDTYEPLCQQCILTCHAGHDISMEKGDFVNCVCHKTNCKFFGQNEKLPKVFSDVYLICTVEMDEIYVTEAISNLHGNRFDIETIRRMKSLWRSYSLPPENTVWKRIIATTVPITSPEFPPKSRRPQSQSPSRTTNIQEEPLT